MASRRLIVIEAAQIGASKTQSPRARGGASPRRAVGDFKTLVKPARRRIIFAEDELISARYSIEIQRDITGGVNSRGAAVKRRPAENYRGVNRRAPLFPIVVRRRIPRDKSGVAALFRAAQKVPPPPGLARGRRLIPGARALIRFNNKLTNRPKIVGKQRGRGSRAQLVYPSSRAFLYTLAINSRLPGRLPQPPGIPDLPRIIIQCARPVCSLNKSRRGSSRSRARACSGGPLFSRESSEPMGIAIVWLQFRRGRLFRARIWRFG